MIYTGVPLMNNIKSRIPPIVLTVFAAVLFIGSFTFLKTCGPKEDGSFMTCHWAGNMIIALGAAVLLQSLIAVFAGSSVRKGLSISNIIDSVILIMTPGTIINTCMMPDMRCNSVTRPGVFILGILIAAASAGMLIMSFKSKNKD